MSQAADASALAGRPRLALGARLRYDEVRGVHVLLLPERIVTLNATGSAILALCDGSRTLSEICEEIVRAYAGDEIGVDVREFVDACVRHGLVR